MWISLCLCVCVDEDGMKGMGLFGCKWVCRWQLGSWEAKVGIHEREEDVRTLGGSAGPLWGQAQAAVSRSVFESVGVAGHDALCRVRCAGVNDTASMCGR